MKKEVNVNFKEGFEKLSRFETECGLFNTQVEGIPLWLYARDRALNIISGITSYSGQSIAAYRVRPMNLVKRIFYFLTHLSSLAGNDLVIFTSERYLEKDLEKNTYYNPFAELAVNRHQNLKKYLVVEFPIPMTTKYQTVSYQHYLPLDFFLVLRQIFTPLSWLYYGRMKQEFKTKLKASGLFNDKEIKELVWRCYYSAYSIKCYGLFLKLVRRLNPQTQAIYSSMGGFDKFPGVIEIQPALIIEGQSVYMYPQTPPIKTYLQDKKMVVFSDQTKDLLVRNGYNQSLIDIESNPKIKYYFLKNVTPARLEKVAIPDNKMVIIGNWGGSLLRIIQQIVAAIEKHPDVFAGWDVALVLHPSEENTYRDLNLKKVKVFENHQVSLWGMLLESVATINIASTVLQESTYFGCYNIILRDVKFDDQEDFVNALCGDYAYKATVLPEQFVDWFVKHQAELKGHLPQKKRLINQKYQYFLGENN